MPSLGGLPRPRIILGRLPLPRPPHWGAAAPTPSPPSKSILCTCRRQATWYRFLNIVGTFTGRLRPRACISGMQAGSQTTPWNPTYTQGPRLSRKQRETNPPGKCRPKTENNQLRTNRKRTGFDYGSARNQIPCWAQAVRSEYISDFTIPLENLPILTQRAGAQFSEPKLSPIMKKQLSKSARLRADPLR
jgi:hypothetical protein